MSPEKSVQKGLDGVIADQTAISLIDPAGNRVLVRGYTLLDLASHCSYEQVAHLLIEGDLVPTRAARAKWNLHATLHHPPEDIRKAAPGKDPSLALNAIISWYALKKNSVNTSSSGELKKASWEFIAQLPFWTACLMRPDVAPAELARHFQANASSSDAFLNAVFPGTFSSVEARIFDRMRILYCEHGFNAASFTARATASTLNDFHSAVAAAAACLKGDNHGGAVRLILPMLDAALKRSPAPYVDQELAARRKIPGFGHRIYKNTDSRFPTILEYLKTMANVTGDSRYLETVIEMRRILAERKQLHPNLELASAPTLRLFGITSEHMVNFICMGRAAGWCAHIIEQCANNRIIRPDAVYVGPAERAIAFETASRNPEVQI